MLDSSVKPSIYSVVAHPSLACLRWETLAIQNGFWYLGCVSTILKLKRTAANRSESTEDHLERIQELIDQKGYARVADLAASLHLSTSAVSNMVRRLARRGFVNYERYRGFTLTATGRQVAQHVKARHQILTELLELLGLGPETVNREVEDIEHHLRPDTLKLFSQLVAFWRAQPEQLDAFKRFSAKKG